MLTQQDVFVILSIMLGITLLGMLLHKLYTKYKRTKKGV